MALNKIIIIVAIIAFIIAIIVIYNKEIKNYFKSKLPKRKKKEVKEEKPKEKKEAKKEPLPSVEEFKPITKIVEDENRDESIEQLLADEDFPFGFDEFDDSFLSEPKKNGGLKSMEQNDELEEFKRMLGREYGEKANKQTIADKIKKLPPEIKVMLMDNVLKKRDDV